ncbi:sensor histidine kinase [Streptomyces varsoviensis]|nr:ATP-binding protein [Streptomyces varsoviensis]
MVGIGSSSHARRPTSALIWLLPPAVVAVCAVVAVASVTPEARPPVAWCGTVAALAVALAAAEAVRRGRLIDALRRRSAEREAVLQDRLDQHVAEIHRLTQEMLPRAVTLLRRSIPLEDVIIQVTPAVEFEPEYATAHRKLLRAVVTAVHIEEDMRETAQRAFVNIARRVQAIVNQQATDIREMEHRHGNQREFFADLLHLDHGNALIGRLADSVAVLGGSRPGRQWNRQIPLYNVLRGAMSRILHYRRVKLHSVADVAIEGPLVEPLIHAVAELLDNATRYSPPETRVHLTATQVQSGVAIEVEDSGVGLTEETRRRAEAVLNSMHGGLDLDDLGEAPRLGLAVVSRLSKTHDFLISLRPSSYGGVRAVLVAPQEIIRPTHAPGGEVASAAVFPPPKIKRRPGSAPPKVPPPMEDPPIAEYHGEGLPQRRRHMPNTPRIRATRASENPPRDSAESLPPREPGLWIDSFMSGFNGPAPEADSGRPNSDAMSDKEE